MTARRRGTRSTRPVATPAARPVSGAAMAAPTTPTATAAMSATHHVARGPPAPKGTARRGPTRLPGGIGRDTTAQPVRGLGDGFVERSPASASPSPAPSIVRRRARGARTMPRHSRMASSEMISATSTRACGVQVRTTDTEPPWRAPASVAGSTRHPLAKPSIKTGGPRVFPRARWPSSLG